MWWRCLCMLPWYFPPIFVVYKVLFGGGGCCYDISFLLRMNHEEYKFHCLGDYLHSLLCSDERHYNRIKSLWYLVEFLSQINNDTKRYRLIQHMMFPPIWLSWNNIKKFKWGNITHYLIFEGLDAIGEAALLIDVDLSSMAQLTNAVGLGKWNRWKIQYFDDLN